MRLTLSVLRCPASGVTETRSFDGGEVSLGRGPDNDWVLADPERHLSKRHCVLAFHGGGWQVADMSTNGTFLNAGSEPLGPGRPGTLENGDRLRLGDYEMEVRIAPAPAASPWADPAWNPQPEHQPQRQAAPSWGGEPSWSGRGATGTAGAAGWRDDPFGQDPFRPAPAQPVAGFGGGVEGRGVTLPADYDPMAPDGESATDRDAWQRHPTQADHSPAIDEAFRPAPVVSTLPDDWADDLLADLPDAPARVVPTRPPAPPIAPPDLEHGPGPAFPLPEAVPVQPPAAPPPVATGPSGDNPVPAEAPRAASASVATVDPSLLAALLEGAGATHVQATDPDAAMRQAGGMLRAAVAGVRQVLIARSAVKSEFRINQTMLSARGNNPLKVSADDDAALEALLGPKRRSDMGAAQAMADALRDVRLHELATATAMQSAIRAVVATFDPAALLANAGGGLSVQRKARAWDALEALHAKVTQRLTDDFDSVFGKSFARAYEQAQEELLQDGSRPENEEYGR